MVTPKNIDTRIRQLQFTYRVIECMKLLGYLRKIALINGVRGATANPPFHLGIFLRYYLWKRRKIAHNSLLGKHIKDPLVFGLISSLNRKNFCKNTGKSPKTLELGRRNKYDVIKRNILNRSFEDSTVLL